MKTEEILNAVYLHGVREGNNPGSRLDDLPSDEMTIMQAFEAINSELSRLKAALEKIASIMEKESGEYELMVTYQIAQEALKGTEKGYGA